VGFYDLALCFNNQSTLLSKAKYDAIPDLFSRPDQPRGTLELPVVAGYFAGAVSPGAPGRAPEPRHRTLPEETP
jgi:hypothetical protein